jgi:hypothetical protein
MPDAATPPADGVFALPSAPPDPDALFNAVGHAIGIIDATNVDLGFILSTDPDALRIPAAWAFTDDDVQAGIKSYFG